MALNRAPEPINNLLEFKAQNLKAIAGSKTAPKSWWTPLWRGLVADGTGKHRQAMGTAIWLFLYLLFYADRKTGTIRRKIKTMSEDTGLPVRTVKDYLARLRQSGYIGTKTTGRALIIEIQKWKLFTKPSRNVAGREDFNK